MEIIKASRHERAGWWKQNRQFGKYTRGSVTLPVIALAATVIGEARNTCDSLSPMRPGKFRFVALMHLMPDLLMRPNVSTGPPRQEAQEALSIIKPPESTEIG